MTTRHCGKATRLWEAIMKPISISMARRPQTRCSPVHESSGSMNCYLHVKKGTCPLSLANLAHACLANAGQKDLQGQYKLDTGCTIRRQEHCSSSVKLDDFL
eukprot:545974-Pelagomonas_calceolata.AAC.1